ncbi:EGF-like domain protein [Dictyocaulus viviparus]|uniref:EGF-like domain protein n=1 Tax=Dictyocaulus viviparus TaxID=29172 RepID=A0A0D8XP75_DICVI|nr:EGF-like domain protein [Dictyocaulus viviparus]
MCRQFYSLKGGYRIVLADDEGNTVEQLAPLSGTEFMGVDNQTTQSQVVRISHVCTNCTIILERQALEWGKNYRFRSCGDVNVLETTSEEQECTGHGTLTSAGCECKKGFKGDLCQYMTNCDHDSECLNGGKCLAEPNSIVVASCYCSYGYFGKNCELKFKHEDNSCFAYSMVDEKYYDIYGMFNSSCYNREKLSDTDFVYYRKVEDDIEIILDYVTTSWVSIGWRPEGLDRSCRLFPDLEGVRSEASANVRVHPALQETSSKRVRVKF